MRLFFVSDIHGSPGALASALDAFDRERAELICFLGDALYHGPRNPLPGDYDPAATAALLNQRKERIVAVRGNCDSEVDQMMLAFPMMADYALVADARRRIFLTHGHRFDPDRLPPLAPGDLFACGHTHIPETRTVGGVFVFNPGSVGLPKEGGPPTYALLEGDRLAIKTLAGEEVSADRPGA